MRDPNRLQPLYNEICRIHKENCPDWRFGQFIINILSESGDIFYVDDDEIIEKIELYFKKKRGISNAGNNL